MDIVAITIYRSLSLLARLLPIEISYLIGETFALATFPLLRSRKRNLEQNLGVILGYDSSPGYRKEVRKLAIATTLNFGRAVVDAFVIPYLNHKHIGVTFSGMDYLESAVRAGKGVILVTAHLGTWELGGAILAERGYKFTTVAGTQFTNRLSPHIKAIKRSKGINVVDHTSVLRIYRELKKGGIVILHIDGDRYLGGIRVNFFGRQTMMPRGPAALALRTGSRVLCGFAIRHSRRQIEIRITREISTQSKDEAELTQNIIDIVQSHIEKYKDQWCMFRPVWG